MLLLSSMAPVKTRGALFLGVRLPELTRRLLVSACLAAHRMAMPRRFQRNSLDALLLALSSEGRAVPQISLAALERDVLRVERILSRAPQLPDTCLYRALSRYAALTRAGLPAVFVMGLPRGGGDDPGHAWIEVFGKPFAEAQSVADLAVTFRYPTSASADRT